jgi:DegV family protein with EDD domain
LDEEKSRIRKVKTDNKIAIVTDSVAQVPRSIAEKWNISVIPLYVNLEGKSYRDGVDLDLAELYRRMREEKIIPTTSAPTIGQFEEEFKNLIHSGAQSILFIALSKKLSSCYDTACLAAKNVRSQFPNNEIIILDSRKASFAEGAIARVAARAASQGELLSRIVEITRQAIPRSGIVASLKTLEYIVRGGRLHKAAYLLGSMINIKPVISINDAEIAVPIAVNRTEKQVMEAMVNFVARKVKGYRSLSVAILEADEAEQAAKLKELILSKLKPTELIQAGITPVMGVHAGPGLLGLAYYYE